MDGAGKPKWLPLNYVYHDMMGTKLTSRHRTKHTPPPEKKTRFFRKSAIHWSQQLRPRQVRADCWCVQAEQVSSDLLSRTSALEQPSKPGGNERDWHPKKSIRQESTGCLRWDVDTGRLGERSQMKLPDKTVSLKEVNIPTLHTNAKQWTHARTWFRSWNR